VTGRLAVGSVVVATGAGFVKDGERVRRRQRSAAAGGHRRREQHRDREHLRGGDQEADPADHRLRPADVRRSARLPSARHQPVPRRRYSGRQRSISNPGAAPAELETQVTRIVENSVATVGDVRHIQSTVSDGVSVTAVEFQFGKDIDRAVNDVRDAVTRVRGDLPGDINEPVITRTTTSGGPMLTYTVKSPGKTPGELSWFVDNDVAKTLLTGARRRPGQADRGVDREVRVVLDARAASPPTASPRPRSAASSAPISVNVPAARARSAAASRASARSAARTSIDALRRCRSRCATAARCASPTSAPSSTAAPTRRRTPSSTTSGRRVPGHPRHRLVVGRRREGGRAGGRAARREHPTIEVELFSSTGRVHRGVVRRVDRGARLGALLAVVVVWWFLRDWRATLISADRRCRCR
jgi:HAE1 family hydrophobic/amphiphilic exporter-1